MIYKCVLCEQRLLVSLQFHKKKVHSWITLCVKGHVIRSDHKGYRRIGDLKY